jgi:hypothetical protein
MLFLRRRVDVVLELFPWLMVDRKLGLWGLSEPTKDDFDFATFEKLLLLREFIY